MEQVYTIRGYSPWMIGDTYQFNAPVEPSKREQLVDAVISLKVERTNPAPDDPQAGPPLNTIRIHFVNKELSDLPKNFVREGLYLTFRPTRTYAYHLDLLRNEGPDIVRLDPETGLFRMTTAGYEAVGEGE